MALETYLRMPELTRRLGIARATIYKLMQQGGFPKPLKLTPRAVAWSQQDIEDSLRRKTAHGSD
ncbi:helix-turn-helix transcriptional regulator [Thermomonas paludicola]|uniref:helix-turn-helix transcriptional regulator n=1 Tax=Thermomonas paludicola TaxID=2884874 RepID=UPI0021143B1D|nr:AlpA family phage regulatory protein [Thermomonas paludicola]